MPKDGKKVAVVGGLGLVILGIWGLTKKAKVISPENIVLSDLIISPVQAYVGEPVSISVVATNIGEAAGSYEVNCEVI
jgi:hypothetical protein